MSRADLPTRRGFLRHWLPLFLGGPLIWAMYFVAVYLSAEGACRLGIWDFRVLGLHGVAVVTVVATLAAAAAVIVLAVRALRRWPEPDDGEGLTERGDYRRVLGFAGAPLGAIFLITILLMGVPALILGPC